ncbi:hypothetical protein ACSBR1_007719 [Camellia fascicularis]
MSSSSSINHLSQPCIYGHFVSSYGERKSRFMKRLSKLFKSGSDRGGMGRRNPQYIGEENMVWRAPARSVGEHSRTDKEREELDRALALSLAEDLKRPPGYRWQTENDEDLRALQDVPNSSSYPPYANVPNSSSYPPYAPTDYYPRDYRPRVGNHQLVGMRTQHQKLTRKCEVTAILVLYGLPRLLTGAILAHELMRGWLRLKGTTWVPSVTFPFFFD